MFLPPTVRKVESFTVTGFSERTQNKDEFNEKTAKIPRLWQQFYASELASNADIYGVYSNYDSDANGFYMVTAGVGYSGAQTELNTVAIQAGNYLVFEGTGSMPAILVETWERIWTFFETNTAYRRHYISDFEAYNGTDNVAIYIGVVS